MPEARRGSAAPWIVSAGAAAALIAMVIVYFVILRPDQDDVVGDFSATETSAVNAAAQEVTNVLSYRRAHFDADFQRAVDGATGSLRSDIASNKATTLSTLTKGKFDLSATVTHKGLEGPADSGKTKGYNVLITVNGYQSNAKDIPKQTDLEVTVVKVKGKWLASAFTNIGVS